MPTSCVSPGLQISSGPHRANKVVNIKSIDYHDVIVSVIPFWGVEDFEVKPSVSFLKRSGMATLIFYAVIQKREALLGHDAGRRVVPVSELLGTGSGLATVLGAKPTCRRM